MSTRASKASTAKPSTSSSLSSASPSSSSSSSSTVATATATATAASAPRLSRGVIVAYLSIVAASVLGLLHLLPVYPHMMVLTLATIYIGSHSSLAAHSHESTTVTETMQTRDALLFPLVGSAVLFSLYVVFKVFPKEYVNVLIKAYFFVFGFVVLSNKAHSLLESTLPPRLVASLSASSFSVTNPLTVWPLTYLAAKEEPAKPAAGAVTGAADTANDEKKSETASATATPAASTEDDRIPITPLYAIAIFISLLIALYYLYSNHWLCSNLFGIAFSIQGIELLSLGSYLNGAILLSGLFIYDIFWVFGTEVMVTVAKSFDAPIKLLFPQTSWEERPSMLGLGDIVIPGIFIALMLRYDYFHYAARRQPAAATKPVAIKATPHIAHPPAHPTAPIPALPSTPFFHAVLVAYFVGLSVTVAVMYHFKAAQPALLYLVPACLGSSVAVAWWHGEVRQMFKYTEGEPVKVEEKKD